MAREGHIPLTEKAEKAVKAYMESRFGYYGVAGYKLQPVDEDKLRYEQELDLQGLGIFRHALSRCWFRFQVRTLVKGANEVGQRHIITPGLRYEHFDGGSNGHDLNVRLTVWDDGKILEDYR